jgi:hypothetical protein
MQKDRSIRSPTSEARSVFSVTKLRKRPSACLRVRCYTLHSEYPEFSTAASLRASASEYRNPLRDCLAGVWADAAFDESIGAFWSGCVWSGGSCLHPHCQ